MIRIGTRESKLALWQATKVQELLKKENIESELIPVKSAGDLDLITPLYDMGVQGVFTKTLDAYLLSNKIDIAVHSMKDVPTQLAKGIQQAAVLERANYKDLLVYKEDHFLFNFSTENKEEQSAFEGIIATGSIRRKAQLLHRFPKLQIENLRGNVQTRMRKLHDLNWDAAIFAAAGLERINERPENAVELDWMLPAPAQGAILIVARANDNETLKKLAILNHLETDLCTKIERDFLQALHGGCSTPISALALKRDNKIIFKGNILSTDGKEKLEVEKSANLKDANNLGKECAMELLKNGAQEIINQFKTIDE